MDIKAQETRDIAAKLMDASRKLADKAFDVMAKREADDKEMVAVQVDLETGKIRTIYDD